MKFRQPSVRSNAARAGLFAFAPLCALAASALLGSRPADAAPPPGYTLFWGDEFHEGIGNQPSKSDWGWQVGPNNANNELEVYTDDVAHSHIVADPDATDGQALQVLSTDDNGTYHSARFSTQGHHDFKYGFIESRIRIPYGQGIWPAFWMLGSNIGDVGWPKCGEVDIMENIGMASWLKKNQASLHSAKDGGGTFDFDAPYHLPAGEFRDRYHLFQCLWLPDTISFYVDGHLYETHTRSEYGDNPYPFDAPFFLIYNVAVGGGWPGNPDSTTVFPQKMLVDYVRVYNGTLRTPATPTNVTATPGDAKPIVVSWTGAPGATSFNLYRGTGPNSWEATPYQTGLQQETFTDQDVTTGQKYYYRVAALNPTGTSPFSTPASAIAPAAALTPYGGKPARIPGRIEAAKFDHGGEGVAYHDTDPENKGGAFRLDTGVDIEEASDPEGVLYDVGYTEPGEWLKYTVDVRKSGDYSVDIHAGSGADGGTLHFEDESGTNLTGPIAIHGTGGWQTWQDFPASLHLTAGRHVLRLVEDTGGYNLLYFEFAPK